MIRFVLRFIGLLSLALGFIFLVHDGTKSIADQTVYISSVGSTWSNIHQNSLTALQPEVERRAGAWVWQGLVQPYFLDQPVSLVLAIIGAILILLGRKKKPLIGYARDCSNGRRRARKRGAHRRCRAYIEATTTGDAAMFMFKKKLEMPSAAEALPGRPTPIPTAREHFVLHRPLKGPYPAGFEKAMFGMGCFWGAERKF